MVFIFASSIEHSKKITLDLCVMGIKCIHVDGGTATRQRDDAIAQFRAGSIDVLCNVNVFTEGFDAPRASVCLLARGTDHPGTYLQMVGRILRPDADSGKQRALLIDLSGSVHKHGLPTDDRTYSLDGQPIREKEKLPALRQCTLCGCVWESQRGRVCPRCGAVAETKPMPRLSEQKLARIFRPKREGPIMANATDEQKRRKLAEWMAIASAKGYKRGWVAWHFKSTFGHWPSWK